MKKCFTINQFRTTEEIKSYQPLLANNIFQAIEIFYPYGQSEEAFINYTNNIKDLMVYHPEMVMHLPFGRQNDLCNLDLYQVVLDRMKAAITYSRQFNIKKFTLHLGYLNNNNREFILKHIIEVLKDLCDHAYPGDLMIENMPGIGEIGYSPQEIMDIIKAVNKPNLKFILDTGHANVSAFTISDYLDLLGSKLRHIHLNDNHGQRDEHARLGTGNINFKELFSQLPNYDDLYCLEILYKDVNDLEIYAADLDKLFRIAVE